LILGISGGGAAPRFSRVVKGQVWDWEYLLLLSICGGCSFRGRFSLWFIYNVETCL